MRLSDARYESIKKDVVKTYKKYNINEIPINPFILAERMGIKLIKYSNMNAEDLFLIGEKIPDGFISPDRTKIFYNDKIISNKIRYTILHEIGHKVREHKEYSQLAETEADWFAAYGIAPPPLINLFNISEYTDIVSIFKTTIDCALYSMGRYVSWKNHTNKNADYEKELLELFKNYK
jgi:hypothetical protein